MFEVKIGYISRMYAAIYKIHLQDVYSQYVVHHQDVLS